MRGVLLGLTCLWISGCTGMGMGSDVATPTDASPEASSDASADGVGDSTTPPDVSQDAGCRTIGTRCIDGRTQACGVGGAQTCVCGTWGPCDTVPDAGPADAGMVPYYLDDDGDGFGVLGGAPRGMVTTGSPAPHGFSLTSDDCNDNAANMFPHAPEPCDGVDENCDGYADNEPYEAMYQAASPLYAAGTCANIARAHGLGGWMMDIYPAGPWCMRPGVAMPGYQTVPQFLCEACPAADAGSSAICQCWDAAGNVMVCPH